MKKKSFALKSQFDTTQISYVLNQTIDINTSFLIYFHLLYISHGITDFFKIIIILDKKD